MGFLGSVGLSGGGGGYLGEVSLVGGVPASQITGLTAGQVVYGAANGHVAQEAAFAYDEATNILTASGGLVSAKAGPSSTQQHVLPAVTSDTFALLLAAQEVKNKTFTDVVGTLGFDNASDHIVKPAARSGNGEQGRQLNLYAGNGGPVSGEGGSWHGSGGDGAGTGSGGGAGWDAGAGTGGSSQHTDIGGNNSVLNTLGRIGATTSIIGIFSQQSGLWSLNSNDTTNAAGLAASAGIAITAAKAISITSGSGFASTVTGDSWLHTATGGNWQASATAAGGNIRLVCGTSGAIQLFDNTPALRTSMSAAGDWDFGTGYLAGSERTAPAAPAANGYRIFAQDNGAGKTQLMVIFNTGAAQQIAIQP